MMRRYAMMLLMLAVLTARAYASDDVTDHGGPVMQSPRVFLIFWLPDGQHFDPSGAAGDARYQSLIRQFVADLPGSSYLNIASEYPGVCTPPRVPNGQPCSGGITVANAAVVTTPYPHAGTAADPLQDEDIRAEIGRFVAASSMTPGLNTTFIVFTAANIVECTPDVGCTTDDFCAYHGSFRLGGNSVIYSYMPNVSSINGCDQGIRRSPNQLTADREIIALSHELLESLTDPLAQEGSAAWSQPLTGNEVADRCMFDYGQLGGDGSNLHLNGHSYVVPTIWSNDASACVLGRSAITGPTIELVADTGGDDARGDSSVTAQLESRDGTPFSTLPLKTEGQPAWNNGSTHVRVFGFGDLPSTALGNVGYALMSHPSGAETEDNWDLDGFHVKIRAADGTLLCQQDRTGSPLSRLTGSGPSQLFPTPNCAGPVVGGVNEVIITVQTGHDDARSDSELWAILPGEPPICLKPSNNAEADGVCPNGGSATDQNGNQSWGNFTTTAQRFTLPTRLPLSALTSLTVQLIEHNSGFETDDNWDIQGITVSARTDLRESLLLSARNERDVGNIDNCIVRLTGSRGRFAFQLSESNPAFATPGIPPGSCRS